METHIPLHERHKHTHARKHRKRNIVEEEKTIYISEILFIWKRKF